MTSDKKNGSIKDCVSMESKKIFYFTTSSQAPGVRFTMSRCAE